MPAIAPPEPNAPAGSLNSAHAPLWPGALLLIAVSLLFYGAYWDRFIGASSGGIFPYTSQLIRAGQVPYRDFCFLVPPLHPLKLAAIMSLFGETLLAARAEAILERTLLAVLVFAWLRRFVRAPAAFMGALLGLAVFAGDPADAIDSYHHSSVFFAICAGFAANLSLEKQGSWRLNWAAIAGLCAGLCFFTKQTTGLGVTAALPIALWAVDWRSGPRPTLTRWTAFAAGWLIPAIAICGWLTANGAFGMFIQSVFRSGGAKGSGLQLLLRPFLQMWPLSIIAAIMLWRLAKFAGMPRDRPQPAQSLALSAVAAITILIGVRFKNWGSVPVFSEIAQFTLILIGLFGIGLVALTLAHRTIKRPLTPPESALLVLSFVGFGADYMLGLSWAAYGPMALPSLALGTALVLDRAAEKGPRTQFAMTAIVLALFTFQAGEKVRQPFSWMEWSETTAQAAITSSPDPMLAGLRVASADQAAFDGIAQRIRQNTTQSDTLLVYPYFPLFYAVTGLRPPTYAFNHFMDVTPDWVVARDFETLRRTPPAVIVFMVQDPEQVSGTEKVFRHGAASETRRIATAITDLTSTDYHLLDSFKVPSEGRELQVWKRNTSQHNTTLSVTVIGTGPASSVRPAPRQDTTLSVTLIGPQQDPALSSTSANLGTGSAIPAQPATRQNSTLFTPFANPEPGRTPIPLATRQNSTLSATFVGPGIPQ